MEDIKKMYVEELRDLAKSRGVPGAEGMKKAELIAALGGSGGGENGPHPDKSEVLFRQFPPGSEPTKDGRPVEGYGPEPDPQEGEPDPGTDNTEKESPGTGQQMEAADQAASAGKTGAPIGKHRSPKDIFRQVVSDIDKNMSDTERRALDDLRRAGWQVFVYPQVENAYVDTAVRSHRVRGRYDIGLVRSKLRR